MIESFLRINVLFCRRRFLTPSLGWIAVVSTTWMDFQGRLNALDGVVWMDLGWLLGPAARFLGFLGRLALATVAKN